MLDNNFLMWWVPTTCQGIELRACCPGMKHPHKMKQVEKDTSFLPGRQLGRLAVILLLVVCGGLVLWMFAPSVYRAAKLSKLEGDAERLLSKGETGSAVMAAKTALLLDKQSVKALDVLADAAEREGSAMAVFFREQLAKIDPGTQRLLDFARVLLSSGKAQQSLSVLEEVPENERNTTSYNNLMSAALLAMGDVARAKVAAERAVEVSGGDHYSLANLVVILLHEPSEESAQRINAMLSELWEDEGFRVRMNRILSGVSRVNGDFATARRLAEDVLAETTHAQPSDQVALLEVMAQQNSNEASQRAREFLAAASDHPLDALPVAAWMLRAGGLAKDVSDWVDALPGEVTKSESLHLLWADAMAQQNRWHEMIEQMDKAEWGPADYVRLAYLARALALSGNEILAGARWRQALRAAASSPQFLWSLWAVTSQWDGWEEREVDLAWSLYEVTRSPSLLTRLSEIYAKRGSAYDLFRVAKLAYSNQPDSFPAANNFAYLALLLDQERELALQIAEKNYLENPADPPRVSTFALALCRDSRAAEALALLDKLPPSQRNAPEFALVDAVALTATGRREAALAAISRAPVDALLDAENKLLESTRAEAESLSR